MARRASNNVGSLGTFNNFDGAGGNDTITGNGNTRIQYSNATAGVTVDFVQGTAIGDVSVGTDHFTGVNAVMGSMFVDHLSGSAGNENFMGLAGNDVIDGRGGFDVAQYNNLTYTTGGISVDFADGIVTGDASNGTDTLRSIEGVQGTNFADSFDATGFGNSDHLNPALYNVGSLGTYNQFEGLGGNDQITGNGNTRAVYLNAAAGVTVDLALGKAHGTAPGDLANVGEDTFVSGVTGVVGSSFGDMLLGSDNTAPGSIEQFDGRGGNDTIDGRGGFDQVVYSNDPNAAAGIAVDMAAGTVDGDTSVGHDTLRSVESVIGTRFADTYHASGFGNSDHLDPATANVGSFGTFNEFQGLGGDDVITGNGNTQLGYYSATAGVTVDLATGTADGDASVGHDTFTGVNHIRASEFADTIYGDGGANTLEGMGGNDLLDGRGGNDDLYGGAGADTFVYTAGADTVHDFNHAEGDRIDLTGIAGVYSLADLNPIQDGPDIVITLRRRQYADAFGRRGHEPYRRRFHLRGPAQPAAGYHRRHLLRHRRHPAHDQHAVDRRQRRRQRSDLGDP